MRMTTNRIDGPRARARRVRAALGLAALAALAGCAEPSHLIGLTVAGGENGFSSSYPGSTVRLYPIAVYSDGVVEYVAAETDWVSSATSVATVVDLGSEGASVAQVAPGEVVITATYQDVSGSVTLTVPPP